MKRLFGQILFVGGVGFASVVVTPACVENDQSIFVRHVMAPPQNRQNGVCLYTPDTTQPFLSEGVLDLAARQTYTGRILIGSQLTSRSDELGVRAEANRTHINGAVVKVTAADGSFIGEFTSVASGFNDPGQGDQATYGVAGMTLLDAATAAKVKPGLRDSRLVIANVKVFGQTLGGVDLESGEFQFPIRVCFGCLVDFSRGDDQAVAGPDCTRPLSESTAGSSIPLPCIAGQDEVTPCQLCTGVSQYCQGRTDRAE